MTSGKENQMELVINMIELINFKGAKHKVVKLNKGVNKIMGCNGSGKTTIASSILWVFADCDYNMTKNPMVTPVGESECKTEVKIWLTMDGKECSVSKTQKFKSKEVDGKVTSSVTNIYAINDVEKSLRDFTADMVDRGVDMENFLIYTHPSAFTADTSKQGREKIRKVLFDMVEDITDADILADMDVPELTALLDNYKLEEVEQMQKSTLKKINDTCGKDNQLIDAKIDGIINSKSTLNKSELEKKKTEYESELSDIETAISDMSKADNDRRSKISEIKAGLSERENKAYEKMQDKKSKLQTDLREKEQVYNNLDVKADTYRNTKRKLEVEKASIEESLERYRSLYKKVQNEVLDESDTKCPTCGREYDKDRIAEIKADFESSKNERLNSYKSRGETYSKKLEDIDKQLADNQKMIEETEKQMGGVKADVESIRTKLRDFPVSADMSADKTYQKMKAEIDKIQDELNKSGDLKLQELSNRKSYLNQMIRQLIGEIAVVDRNKELDAQIASLREEKKQAEINRANAEKVIDQVEQFKKVKNKKLTAEINKHFSLVEWHLWELLKNGNYSEITEPYVDGKPMTTSANGSLVTLAKISICNDIQKYKGVSYPIISDDYSLFSKNTENRLKVDGQFIGLVVTEDTEIKVEGE
jgi:chromosome segregation ATPase